MMTSSNPSRFKAMYEMNFYIFISLYFSNTSYFSKLFQSNRSDSR